MSIDVDTVSDLIRDVSARVIDPRFRTLHDHQIHQKKPGDFVTDADRQAECELGAAVTKYAGGIVVGEESAFADPTILDAVSDADLAWVIDPIDGTKNFVHGSVITASCLLSSAVVKQSEDGYGSRSTGTCGSLSMAPE